MPNPTGPRVRARGGDTVLHDFLASFRVEGLPKERDVPVLPFEGGAGALTNPDLITARNTRISVSGKLYAEGGVSQTQQQAAIEAELDNIMAALTKDKEIWLSRDTDDTRFAPVRFRSLSHSYVERIKRTVAVCQFSFEWLDPFIYALTHTLTERTVAVASEVLTVTNNGNAKAYPVIWITGQTDGVNVTTNPKVTNYDTGAWLQYTGSLQAGEILVLDPRRYLARKFTTNTLHSGTAQAGGTDTITLAAGASSDDEYYNERVIEITGGTGAGQVRRIERYIGVKRLAGVESDWSTAPDATSTYTIYYLPFVAGQNVGEARWEDLSLGTNVLSSMNSGYYLDGFPLTAGANRLELEEANALMKLSVVHRDTWY